MLLRMTFLPPLEIANIKFRSVVIGLPGALGESTRRFPRPKLFIIRTKSWMYLSKNFEREQQIRVSRLFIQDDLEQKRRRESVPASVAASTFLPNVHSEGLERGQNCHSRPQFCFLARRKLAPRFSVRAVDHSYH